MTAENFIKAQLLLLAWREGRIYGGIDNTLAVAFVIRNRVKAGWLGGDWLKVIAGHYNYAAHGKTEEMMPDPRNIEFRMCMQKIDDIFTGMAPDRMTTTPDNPGGALYYCELGSPLAISDWFRKNILDKQEEHPRVGTVGPVYLFR